jgi:hypothetical protein
MLTHTQTHARTHTAAHIIEIAVLDATPVMAEVFLNHVLPDIGIAQPIDQVFEPLTA